MWYDTGIKKEGRGRKEFFYDMHKNTNVINKQKGKIMATPVKVNLEANKTHYFCTCGKSADSVLCDGSHKGTTYTPQQFTVDSTKEYSLCACKKSGNLPFCDGTHRK